MRRFSIRGEDGKPTGDSWVSRSGCRELRLSGTFHQHEYGMPQECAKNAKLENQLLQFLRLVRLFVAMQFQVCGRNALLKKDSKLYTGHKSARHDVRGIGDGDLHRGGHNGARCQETSRPNAGCQPPLPVPMVTSIKRIIRVGIRIWGGHINARCVIGIGRRWH